jgi:hypothetical protein
LFSDIEATCRKAWVDDDDACRDAPLRPIAEDYAAFYGTREDPRANDGPIDALPRLGAERASADVMTSRMGVACRDRCGIARRQSVAEALPSAVEACATGRGATACEGLGRGRAKNAPVEEAIDRCEGQCDNQRANQQHFVAIERSRPRNRAERVACLRRCVGRSDAARLVFEPGGDVRLEPTDWCGTTAVNCMYKCQIR